MAQQVGVGGQPDAGRQVGEGAAGVVGLTGVAPLGAEDQVQLDRAGWPAGFDPSKRNRLGLPAGKTQAGLLAAVLAQCLDGEGWQGEDGVAGRGLERPDGQLSAPAVDVAITVAGVGEDGGVDDGAGLVEPDGAGIQVQVGPFQAAELAVAGPVAAARTVQVPSQGLVVRAAASSSVATCSGASATAWVRGTGGGGVAGGVVGEQSPGDGLGQGAGGVAAQGLEAAGAVGAAG
jgi:hypothetical protein